MNKILFVCINPLGVGEAASAAAFAAEVEKAGYAASFLVFPSSRDVVASRGTVHCLRCSKLKNKEIFDRVCRQEKPDVIVVADASLVGFGHAARHLFDIGWVRSNPVSARYVSFDHMGVSGIAEKVQLVSDESIMERLGWFEPVDGIPLLGHAHSASWQRLYGDERERCRSAVGVKPGGRLVVLAVSRWAMQVVIGAAERPADWLSSISFLVWTMLQLVERGSVLAVLSPYPLCEGYPSERLTVLNRAHVDWREFKQLLGSADLILSTSIFSDIHAQCRLAGISSAAICCSGYDHFDEARVPAELRSWYNTARRNIPGMLERSALFPLGWSDLAARAGLLQRVPSLDILKPVDAMAKVRELLELDAVPVTHDGMTACDSISAILK